MRNKHVGQAYSEPLQFPLIRQSDDSSCGPASIKMVLLYFGIDATEDYIKSLCDHTYETGCTNEGMMDAIKEFGLGCDLLTDMTVEDLDYWTRHKVPVIIDWFSTDKTDGTGYGHSSVVAGVNTNHVIVYDPLKSSVSYIPIEEFTESWFDFDNDYKVVKSAGILVYPERLM